MILRDALLAAVLCVVAATTLTLGAAVAAAQQQPFEAAVIVNDKVVTNYDVEQRARLLALNGAPQDAQLREIALQQLIEDRIRRAAAAEAGIVATEQAIDAAVEDYASQRGVPVGALEAALARAGVDRAALEDALAAELEWREAVRRRFGPRADPSDAELDQELSLAVGGRIRSYRLQEIALPFAARGEAATRALAERLSEELSSGAEFASAARRESASPSAAQGGDIGWIQESALPASAAEALARVDVGEVTEPIEIGGGLALLRIADQRVEEAPEAGKETVDLVMIQAAGGDASSRLAAALAANPSCEQAASLAESDPELRTQRSEPTDYAALQARTREAIEGVPEGGHSDVVEMQGGAIAFVVCSRVSGASPQSREALREQVRSQRLQGFAAGWLQELRSEAVIERR